MIAIHPKYPNYLIRDDGRVFRREPDGSQGQEVSGRILSSGYRQHKLYQGKKCFERTNRLVLEAFCGPPPFAGAVSAHNDGNKLNNSISNLRWATSKENSDDMERHGTRCRGSGVSTSVLTEQDVKDIRASYTGRRGDKTALAKKYSVGRQTIARVINGEYWRHVDGAGVVNFQSEWDRMTRDERTEALLDGSRRGLSRQQMAAELGTTLHAVSGHACKYRIKFAPRWMPPDAWRSFLDKMREAR